MFGSPDYTVLPYNQGTPVFFCENLFEISGTPVTNLFESYGDSCENLLKFWQSYDLLRLWYMCVCHVVRDMSLALMYTLALNRL